MLIPIIEHEGRYLHRMKGASRYYISKCGAIYSTYKNELLKPSPQSNGYLQTGFRLDDGSYKRLLVSRLVALQFTYNPDPESKVQVNHINGNKRDCRVRNLEWLTNTENNHHARKIGLMPSAGKPANRSIIRGLCAPVQHDQIIPRFYRFEPVPTSCPKSDTDATRA